MSFQNKVILITGASSGIGAATVIKFVEEGASVAMVGRNKERLHKSSSNFLWFNGYHPTLCETKGSKPLVLVADVTEDEALKNIINETITHFGKLDVLINNAGTVAIEPILSENAMAVFDKIIATNLRSAVYLTHLSAPHLIKTKGNIVNVSSIAGLRIALTDTFAYDTSKAGLDHFTRSVALELAQKGVRVNSVNPGLVLTAIARNVGVDSEQEDNFWKHLAKTAPLGKIASAEEISDLILFIASDKAKSITGSSFVSDNGAMLLPHIGNVKQQII